MIPIRDFAWQGVEPVELTDSTVGELLRIMDQFPHRSPVVWSERIGSAIVSPSLVHQIRDLDLVSDQLLTMSGAWDLFRTGQIAVHERQPATQVLTTTAISPQKVNWVIAVDDRGRPTGLLAPGHLRRILPRTSVVAESEVQQEIVDRLLDRDLAGALGLIDSKIGYFRSSRVNMSRPVLFECADHGNPHLVHSSPCSEHPTAPTYPVDL
jgi:hypothetical protein